MGASGNVDLQFTASDQAAQQAWRSQQRLADSLIKKMEKLDQVTKQASNSFKMPDIGNFAGQIVGITSAATAFATVIRQARVEFDAILKERDGAAFDQVQYRRSVGNAFRNSGNLYAKPEDLDRYIAETARNTKQPRTKVAQMVDSGLSAQGASTAEDLKSVQETMIETLKTYPELSADDSKVVLGAAQDIRSKTPGMSAREAVGFNLKMGQVARVVDPMAQAKNLAGPTANLMSFKMSLQEAGALVATMTHGMKDLTGEMSGGAALKLGDELGERLPKLKSFRERLEAFRDHPEWVDAYFDGGIIDGQKFEKAETGNGKAKPTIRALFDRNSLDSRKMAEFEAEIGTFESIDEFTKKHQEDIDKLAGSKVEEIQRAAESIKQDIRLEQERAGVLAATEDSLKDILTAAGVSQLEQDSMIFKLRTGGHSTEELPKVAAQLLRHQEAELRSRNRGEGRDSILSTQSDRLVIPMQALAGSLPTAEELDKTAGMLGKAAADFDEIGEKYSIPGDQKNFLTKYQQEEIQRYRREIAAGRKPDTRPLKSRLMYPRPEDTPAGKRAEELVSELETKLASGFSEDEIPDLRGKVRFAGETAEGLGRNSIAWMLHGRLDAVAEQIDQADPGRRGMLGRIGEEMQAEYDLFGDIGPDSARRYKEVLNQLRQSGGNLPQVENQALQQKLDRLSESLDAYTEAINRNTQATEQNTQGSNGAAPIGPQSSRDAMRRDGYKPVSGRLGRIS